MPSLPLNANWTAIHYYTNAPPSPANASLKCCPSAWTPRTSRTKATSTNKNMGASMGFSPVSPIIANLYMEEFEAKAIRTHPIGVTEICWRHLREDPWVLCQRVHGTPQQHWWKHKVHHRTGIGRQAAVPGLMHHTQWWWFFGSHSIPKTHTRRTVFELLL